MEALIADAAALLAAGGPSEGLEEDDDCYVGELVGPAAEAAAEIRRAKEAASGAEHVMVS